MNKISSAFAVFVFLALLATYIFWGAAYHWDSVWEYRYVFLRGWLHTIFIAVIALALSLSFGLFVALLGRSSILFFRYLSRVYVALIRGTPLLVQILFFYYVVGSQIGLQNRYISGIIILSIFTGAYISEIIRAGIEGIAASQLETAKAIGLTQKQTYLYVIIPQAFKQTLPPLAGQLASLIKDSSLLSIIGISELTFVAEQISSATFSTLESFFPLALGYLVLSLPITIFSQHLERRYAYEN